jgi:hypothetical protein
MSAQREQILGDHQALCKFLSVDRSSRFALNADEDVRSQREGLS